MIKSGWHRRGFVGRLRHWCRAEPVSAVIVTLACALGGWLRLFRLPETMMFMGDQGRDAMIVADIFRHFDLVFIGPVTSVGNMYLGPFYYYFMLPWLWLSYPSPLGPVIAVALVNTLAVGLVYFLGRRLVGKKAALVACVLTAISAVAATYSRFSWNPNLSLLFSLLTLYYTHQAFTKNPQKWLCVGLLAGILVQLHYVNLVLVGVCGLFWLLEAIYVSKNAAKTARRDFWRCSLGAMTIWALTFLPLALFDWRHGWINIQALGGIFAAESSFADSNLFISIFTGTLGIFGRIAHIFTTLSFPHIETDLAFLHDSVYWVRVGYGLIVFLSFAALVCGDTAKYIKRHSSKQGKIISWFQGLVMGVDRERLAGDWLLLTTCVATVITLAFYRHSVFDHYVLYFLPVLFLLYGRLLTCWSWRTSLTLVTIFLLIFALGNRPDYLQPNGLPYQSTWNATRKIVEMLPADDRFDFILIDGNGDLWGEHYRYFFESETDKILPHEEFDAADDLIVIDEMHNVNLYDNPSYELVIFRNLPEATSELMFSEPQREVYRLYRRTGSADEQWEEEHYE